MWVEGNSPNRVDPSGEFACGGLCIGGLILLLLGTAGCTLGSNPETTPTIQSTVFIGTAVPTLVPLTPVLTDTATPPPSATPMPTPVPPPPPTEVPNPARLPLDGAILTVPYGCSWTNSNDSPLKSRDVNPRECDGSGTCKAVGGAMNPVFAPVPEAEIMIVDEDAGYNGKFVAMRVNTQYLPHLGLGEGYLYIGYSHLSQIYVSAGGGRSPYPVAGHGAIGVSGQSGTDNVHLDIMMFFTSSESALLEPSQAQAGTETNMHHNYQSFFRLAGIGNFAPFVITQEVDPLRLWPELNSPPVCG